MNYNSERVTPQIPKTLSGKPGSGIEVRRKRMLGGFSIIEFLVAITIGSFLMAGAIQIFIANKKTYALQQNLATIFESARFGTAYMRRTLRMTAYRGSTLNVWIQGPLTLASIHTPLAGTDNDTNAANSIKDATDIIAVLYEGNDDGFIKDCFGNTVATNVTITNTFQVTTDNELQCTTNDGTTIGPFTLVEGVESMQILFGLDTDGDQITNSYVTANNITTPYDTDDIISLRIGLLLVSEDDFLALATDTKTWQVLDETVYNAASPANDKRLRKVVSYTVQLRNRL